MIDPAIFGDVTDIVAAAAKRLPITERAIRGGALANFESIDS